MQIGLGRATLTPGARRIADAAVDVAAERGYEGLSVRAVAQRAGVTGGAVQHHFATRADLVTAALVRTAERIAARLEPDDPDQPERRRLLALAEELLPLDETRRRECVVWAVLSAAAATDPALAAVHRDAVGLLVSAMAPAFGGDSPGQRSARVLAAVLDGLTLQALSGTYAPDEVRSLAAAAIDALLPA